MNSQSKWPLICVCALAGGWLIGYVMGGKSAPNTADVNGGKSRAALVPSGERHPQDVKKTADDEKQAGRIMISALRDPYILRRNRNLYDTILKMSPGETTAAVAIAETLPSTDRNHVMWLLFQRLAECDPREAMKFALSRKQSTGDDHTGAVMDAWAAIDMKAAKEWAEAMPPGAERIQATQSILRTLLEEDPAAALQVIRTFPAGSYPSSVYQHIFAAWAARSPAVAAEQALAFPEGESRYEAIRGTVNGWLENDPKAALAWVAQVANPRLRRESLHDAYERWARRDPKAASTAVLALPHGEDRARALDTVALAASELEPEAIIAFIEQMPAGYARDATIKNRVGSWSRKDRDTALAWVAQLPAGETKTAARWTIALEWAGADPRAAVTYIMENGTLSLKDRHDSIAHLAGKWAGSDSQGALAWVRELWDEKVRNLAMRSVITTVGERDPRQAARLLAELPPESQSGLVSSLVHNWARDDADSAAEWVMQLPEGEAKSDGASAIIFEMTKYGLVKASGWLEKLPTGGSRDAAVKSFTNSIGEDDPGGAVALAASISNAPMRNSEVERWARTWLLRDKAAATKWIAQNAALDWAVKRRLLWKD